MGLGQAGEPQLEFANLALKGKAPTLQSTQFVCHVCHHVAPDVLHVGIQSANLVGSRLDVYQHGRATGFKLHQFSDLLRHQGVVEHEVARGRKRGFWRNQKFSEVVEGLGLHIEFPKLLFQFDQRVEILRFFTREVEDVVLSTVKVHLAFQGVCERVDFLKLIVDELLRLQIRGQSRFSSVLNVGGCECVQKALGSGRQHVVACQGDHTRALNICGLQGATVLAYSLIPRFDADAEVLFGGQIQTFGIRGYFRVEMDGKVDALSAYRLTKL